MESCGKFPPRHRKANKNIFYGVKKSDRYTDKYFEKGTDAENRTDGTVLFLVFFNFFKKNDKNL